MSAPRPCSGVVGACNEWFARNEGGGEVWWRVVCGWLGERCGGIKGKGKKKRKKERKKDERGGGRGERRRSRRKFVVFDGSKRRCFGGGGAGECVKWKMGVREGGREGRKEGW